MNVTKESLTEMDMEKKTIFGCFTRRRLINLEFMETQSLRIACFFLNILMKKKITIFVVMTGQLINRYEYLVMSCITYQHDLRKSSRTYCSVSAI